MRSSPAVWDSGGAQYRWPLRTEVRVYPDIHQVARFTMLARRDRLSSMGVRRSRRLGTDNEFERLRDYIEGDDPRHIDWRASARRSKLTSRAFQQNQSQRIIFLIDCGRLMAGDTGDGLSPLGPCVQRHAALGPRRLDPGRSGGTAGVLGSGSGVTWLPAAARGESTGWSIAFTTSFPKWSSLVMIVPSSSWNSAVGSVRWSS